MDTPEEGWDVYLANKEVAESKKRKANQVGGTSRRLISEGRSTLPVPGCPDFGGSDSDECVTGVGARVAECNGVGVSTER